MLPYEAGMLRCDCAGAEKLVFLQLSRSFYLTRQKVTDGLT